MRRLNQNRRTYLVNLQFVENILQHLVILYHLILILGIKIHLSKGQFRRRSRQARPWKIWGLTLCIGTTPGWTESINWHCTAPLDVWGIGTHLLETRDKPFINNPRNGKEKIEIKHYGRRLLWIFGIKVSECNNEIAKFFSRLTCIQRSCVQIPPIP